jgi:AraC family transcriptional regulator
MHPQFIGARPELGVLQRTPRAQDGPTGFCNDGKSSSMSLSSTDPAASPRTAADAAHHAIRYGVSAYGSLLVAAGGQELEALMRDADRSAVCSALYVSPPYDLLVPPLTVPRLSINLTHSRVSGGIDGERHHAFEARRHSLFLTPAGAAVRWRKESPSRHLNIYFHADAFNGDDDEAPRMHKEQPLFNATIPGMQPLADQLVDELCNPGPLSAEAADSLTCLLLVRLARHQRQTAKVANPLTPLALARLRDYVAEHLGERILVTDLAKQAGLSSSRFAHAFSEKVGQSPHRFVLSMRLERATELLRHSRLSPADVAQTCGFASQQHLTNAMRRSWGITPGRYRAQFKSQDER